MMGAIAVTLIEFLRGAVWAAANGGRDKWLAAQPKIDALYRWSERKALPPKPDDVSNGVG